MSFITTGCTESSLQGVFVYARSTSVDIRTGLAGRGALVTNCAVLESSSGTSVQAEHLIHVDEGRETSSASELVCKTVSASADCARNANSIFNFKAIVTVLSQRAELLTRVKEVCSLAGEARSGICANVTEGNTLLAH